jgi:hypothetical protein
VGERRRALVRRADDKKLRRGAHRSVRDLKTDIRVWIEAWNQAPRPYVWTKTTEHILESISRYYGLDPAGVVASGRRC